MQNQAKNLWIIETENGKYDPEGLLYWNNDDGWVDRKSSSVFSDKQKNDFTLPTGGKWLNLSNSV